MTPPSDKILIFEDQDSNWDELNTELDTAISDTELTYERFTPEFAEDSDNVLSDLRSQISRPTYPLLVVLDYDLTASSDNVRREHVQQVCDDEYIPLCIFHRERGDMDDLRRVQEYEEDSIKIDPSKGFAEIADGCVDIGKGFWDLYTNFEEFEESDGEDVIPNLLNAPQAVRAKLDQYQWGNPAQIMGQDEIDEETRHRRTITLLGYWIRNELLEFPGALLNDVALSAYLDVDHETFVDDEQYQAPFQEALYDGPFSTLDDWWWSLYIDEIRAENMHEGDSELPLGPDLFERLDVPEIGHSICQDDEDGGHETARYFCILNQAPVCEDHSRIPSGWIPMGATRSRVSETKYHQLGPWLLD